MRRGTQGHVAAPRGPHECLRGTCDVIFIFTRIRMVIVHISIRYFGFTLTTIANDSPSFSSCGTMTPYFICSQAAWRDVERRIKSAMKIARRCGGHEVHPIKDHRTCFKST